jgi:hypothetical protein
MPTRDRDARAAQAIPLGSRRPWLWLSAALTVLGGLELLLGGLIIRAVADPPVSSVLKWALGLVTAALLIGVASPFFARVQVGAGEPQISFGLRCGCAHDRRGATTPACAPTPPA